MLRLIIQKALVLKIERPIRGDTSSWGLCLTGIRRQSLYVDSPLLPPNSHTTLQAYRKRRTGRGATDLLFLSRLLLNIFVVVRMRQVTPQTISLNPTVHRSAYTPPFAFLLAKQAEAVVVVSVCRARYSNTLSLLCTVLRTVVATRCHAIWPSLTPNLAGGFGYPIEWHDISSLAGRTLVSAV